MVLDISQYNAAYYGDVTESGGLRHDAGYTDYLREYAENRFDEGREGDSYNPRLQHIIKRAFTVDPISPTDFRVDTSIPDELSVLDIGGATGIFSRAGKEIGVTKWDVLDLDIDTWCSRHKVSSVDNFISGDAQDVLPTMSDNQYDVIFSHDVLVCFTEEKLSRLIEQMNRVSKKQVHIFSQTPNTKYYESHPLSWYINLGFMGRSLLISKDTNEVMVA